MSDKQDAFDEDIKIAGDHFVLPPPDRDEEEPIALELKKNKDNGNIEKAKKLAQSLAGLVSDSCAFSRFAGSLPQDPAEIEQAKILFAFTVDSLWGALMPNEITAQSAASEFLSKLSELDPDFYAVICQAEGFSLYLLEGKTKGDPQKIGLTFAKLCRKENDSGLALLGKELYIRFKDYISEQIKDSSFLS